MPRTYRKATTKDRAIAVATAEKLGSSELAGEQLGFNPRSIRRWRDDPKLAEIVRKTREETAEDVSAVMVMAWSRLIERLDRDEVETRDLIILAGVATDKSQLLSGNPTDRTEHRDITDNLDDHEREALNDAIRGELARRADSRTAVDAVGSTGETGAESPTG